MGSTSWGCRNVLFPLQRRLKRCGDAAGTASPWGRSPSIYFPLYEAALLYRRACLCTAGWPHLPAQNSFVCLQQTARKTFKSLQLCAAWHKAMAPPEPSEFPHCSWTENLSVRGWPVKKCWVLFNTITPTNLEDLKQADKNTLKELEVLIYIQKSGKILSLCSFNLFWCTPLQLSQGTPSFPHFWARDMGQCPGTLKTGKQLPVLPAGRQNFILCWCDPDVQVSSWTRHFS